MFQGSPLKKLKYEHLNISEEKWIGPGETPIDIEAQRTQSLDNARNGSLKMVNWVLIYEESHEYKRTELVSVRLIFFQSNYMLFSKKRHL